MPQGHYGRGDRPNQGSNQGGGPYGNQRGQGGGGGHQGNSHSYVKIDIATASPNDFMKNARTDAQMLGKGGANTSKSAIRRFYSDLISIESYVNGDKDKFAERHLDILMLSAKSHYQKNRDPRKFSGLKDFIEALVSKVKDPGSLIKAKVYFEAVLGFGEFEGKA